MYLQVKLNAQLVMSSGLNGCLWIKTTPYRPRCKPIAPLTWHSESQRLQ